MYTVRLHAIRLWSTVDRNLRLAASICQGRCLILTRRHIDARVASEEVAGDDVDLRDLDRPVIKLSKAHAST
jgi:hypothetical protein